MMACTLDLYPDYLLSSTGPTTVTGLSRRLDGAPSHNHITRWLSRGTYGQAEVWRQAKRLIRQAEAQRPAEEFAVLIVDDSVLEMAHTDANGLIQPALPGRRAGPVHRRRGGAQNGTRLPA